MENLVDQSFWSGKRVLVTGHTGFKGAWLVRWLQHLGSDVSGFALPPDSPSLFLDLGLANTMDSTLGDVIDSEALAQCVANCEPDVVFHLAAQALVRESYESPLETFATNVMGTASVLEALRTVDHPCAAVIVTTDKCYENPEDARPFKESDRLGGKDPYSASKAAAELVTSSYRSSFFSESPVHIASARAGNVIGGGDWADNRLVPDMIRAVQKMQPMRIRNPDAVRPWQHVLDPLGGYLKLAERLYTSQDYAQAYNFGPATTETATVRDVITMVQQKLPQLDVIQDEDPGPPEAGLLMLDASKAQDELGFSSQLDTRQAVAWTVDWYLNYLNGEDPQQLIDEQIRMYNA